MKQTIIVIENDSVSMQKLAKLLSDAAAYADSDEQDTTIHQPKTPCIKSHGRDFALIQAITKIFIVVGIPANIKGYQFLREAVNQSVKSPHLIYNVSRQLYPAVAAEFSTSSTIVEASIRHAIEVAWNRGASERLNALFGINVYRQNEKPSNSELIALIADKVSLECAV